MSQNYWRFVNRLSPERVIVVTDAQSAQVLASVLGKYEPEAWVIQGEQVLGSSAGTTTSAPAASAPAPAPSASAPAPSASALAASASASASSVPAPAPSPMSVSAPPTASSPNPKVPVVRPSLFNNRQTAPAATASNVQTENPTRATVEKSPSPTPSPSASPAMAESQQAKQENRRHTRYDMEFKVILVSEGKTFRSFSNNVSVGGMALKHKIPDTLMNRYCRVVISRRDAMENIEFNCKILVSPTEDAKRLEFVECDPAVVAGLRAWIDAGLAEQAARARGGKNRVA